MKTLTTHLKHGINKLKMMYWLLPSLSMLLPTRLFADFSNPWASAAPTDPGNVSQTVDKDTSNTLEAVLLVAGVALIITGIAVVRAQMNKGAEEKKDEGPGKSVMWMLIGVLGVVIGLVLVALAWLGASALSKGQ